MTISNLPVSVQYTGNGSLTTYSFDFQIFFDTDVEVYLGTTLQTLTSQYTVSFTAGTAGGNVVFVTAPASGAIITLLRDVADARTTTYAQDGDFISTVVNADFDRLTAKDQEHDYQINNRVINIPATDPALVVTLPVAANRANKYLAFDGSGNVVVSTGTGGGGPTPQAYPVANVTAYGADPTGASDSTTAINTAIASGTTVYIPKGTYKVTSDLICATNGQIIFGDGVNDTGTGGTIITVSSNSGFSKGVFQFTCGEQGPQLRDFVIQFTQPDTATRASLTDYVPAIYAQNTPRFTLRDLGIYQAIVAIDMRGNSGGASILSCQVSGYGTTSTGGGLILIDGSLDTIRIENLHIYPFTTTSNQQEIFYASGTVGINSGRADDLKLIGCLFECGLGCNFYYGSFTSNAGSTFGSITACNFDSYNGIVAAGDSSGDDTGPILAITSTDFTIAVSGTEAIVLTGGHITMSGCFVENGHASATITVNNTTAGRTDFIWTGGWCINNAEDATDIAVTGNASCDVILQGIKFYRYPNVSFSNPTISIASGPRATIVGCTTLDKGTGTGTFIDVAADGFHNIQGNTCPNWTNTFPTASVGIYANNNSSGTSGAGQGPYATTSTFGIVKPDNSSITISNGVISSSGSSSSPVQQTIASASTCDIGSKGTNVQITGTTTITSLGTSGTTGVLYYVEFAGALTLTYNATSLAMPGNANITTAAGDFMIALCVNGSSGYWDILNYYPQSGEALVGGSGGITALTGDVTASGTGSVAATVVHAPASGITGTTLASNVTGSSLTSAAGGSFGSLAYASAAAAGTLTGSTLASNVTASSLTSLGVLSSVTATSFVQQSGGSLSYTGGRNIIQDNGSLTAIGNSSVNIYTQNSLYPGTNNAFYCGTSGNGWAGVGAYAFNNLSDAREKTNIKDCELGLEWINTLKARSYNWANGNDTTRQHHGLIAQELKESLGDRPFGGLSEPKDDEERYTISYNELIAPLIKAIQQLSAKVDRLEHGSR